MGTGGADTYTLKGIVISARRTGMEALHHIIRLQVTEDNEQAGILTGDVVYATGNIKPVIARNGMSLQLTGTLHDSASLRVFDFSDAHSDVLEGSSQTIIHYLTDGRVANITGLEAEQIVNHFGTDTIKVLNADPGKIKEVRGISRLAKQTIAASWKNHQINNEQAAT